MTLIKCRSELEAHCPVLNRQVTLNYVRMLTYRTALIEEKQCSAMNKCQKDYGDIALIERCLLNTVE
jgi:hypothetical protein